MAANPVEPEMALHQSLPDLLRNLLRNPVEPDLALHQSLPDLLLNLRDFLWNLVEPDRAPGLKTPLACAVEEKHFGKCPLGGTHSWKASLLDNTDLLFYHFRFIHPTFLFGLYIFWFNPRICRSGSVETAQELFFFTNLPDGRLMEGLMQAPVSWPVTSSHSWPYIALT